VDLWSASTDDGSFRRHSVVIDTAFFRCTDRVLLRPFVAIRTPARARAMSSTRQHDPWQRSHRQAPRYAPRPRVMRKVRSSPPSASFTKPIISSGLRSTDCTASRHSPSTFTLCVAKSTVDAEHVRLRLDIYIIEQPCTRLESTALTCSRKGHYESIRYHQESATWRPIGWGGDGATAVRSEDSRRQRDWSWPQPRAPKIGHANTWKAEEAA